MIELELLNFGVLGLWTVSLIRKEWSFEQHLRKRLIHFDKTINKLTSAIERKL